MTSKYDINQLALRAFTTTVDNEQQQTPFPLSNLLTEREKITIGRRLLIAHAIIEGKTRYEINQHIRVSPNTFAQIRKWLNADCTSYTAAYTHQRKDKQQTQERPSSFSYAHLKKNYPAHFLLFSLVEELFKT